jgi:hypothetical protein
MTEIHDIRRSGEHNSWCAAPPHRLLELLGVPEVTLGGFPSP